MTGTFWVLAFLLAPLLTAAVAVAAWRHRSDNPPASALALTLSGITGWSLATALILAPVPAGVRALGFPWIFLSVGATVLGFWALSQLLVDPEWRATRRRWVLLGLEPPVLALLSVLPATSDLVFGRTDLTAPAGAVQLVAGPLFAVHAVYSYTLILVTLGRLVGAARRSSPVVRRQAIILLLSAAPPAIGNVVMTTGMRGDGVVDLTPLFFIVTGLIAGWAVLRTGILTLVPVARDQVVESMTDAVMVNDAAGRLIDLNPAARDLFARLRPEAGSQVIGQPLGELIGEDLVEVVLPDGRGADGSYSGGRAIVQAAPDCWLDVQSLPVAVGGRRVGRLTVVRDVSEEQAREADLRRLNRQLAEQVETIEQLRATLAEEAVRDPLTGLHNRRHLDRALAHALARSVDDGLSLAVLVLDIDHFKAVNDGFGHAVGDDVLGAVADQLRAGTRAGDTVARSGGEEFVLVLPGADRDEALARAETIRARCAALQHVVPGTSLQVTVSVGVAVTRPGGAAAHELLAAADRALYRAKAAGRDRVVAAETPGTDVRDVLSPV